MKIEFTTTPRGYVRGTFDDAHDSKCAIQETCLLGPTEVPAMWLGVEEDAMGQRHCRMMLTRHDAAHLLPYLASFVLTGRLPRLDGVAVSVTASVPTAIIDAYAHLLAEYRRWMDEPEDGGHGDALAAELAAAIRLGAIGAVSNVIAAIALPASKFSAVPLIGVVNSGENSGREK